MTKKHKYNILSTRWCYLFEFDKMLDNEVMVFEKKGKGYCSSDIAVYNTTVGKVDIVICYVPKTNVGACVLYQTTPFNPIFLHLIC